MSRHPEDTYNFDETGFQMGQISTSMVVTATDRQGRPKQIKPTNTQWVTLIQGVCADGSTIPPFIGFKGKEFNKTWFHQGLPSTWTFSVNPNGWTTNQIGLQWIQHFERHTRSKTIGSKRLLVLDNDERHITSEFRSFCEDNNIILLWMPPHSSPLQPLDVSCFGPLKQAFSKQNQNLIKNHIFHINKEDFLSSFYTAFLASFTRSNIQAGFRGSGLYPFDPEAVLSQLEPVLRSPNLPLSEESWCTKTPSNTQEVVKQATLIKKRLERHQGSSPTPIYEADSSPPDGTELRHANQVANTVVRESTLQTPVKRYIERATSALERTQSELVLPRKETTAQRELLRKRKECKKGKRVALKGRFVFNTLEVLDVVEKAEAEAAKKKPKKKRGKQPIAIEIEDDVDEDLEHVSSESESDCIVVAASR